MNNRDLLIALYKDIEFKTAFISGYIESGVHQFVAEKEFSNAFGLLVEDKGSNGSLPLSSASISDIKRTFLAISSYGISFDRNAKEIYLLCESTPNGNVSIEYLLGYRGMKRIIANTKTIRSHNTEIVYAKDSFTWLGADQRPNYASNGQTQGSDIVCGFTTFTFIDGNVLCHRSNAQELLDIEKNSIQQNIDMGGQPDSSIYQSAWRERCLRILTLRAAFREFQHLFMTDKALVEQNTDTSELDNAQTGAFEAMLNESTTEEALSASCV
jgi:hypothetical protein